MGHVGAALDLWDSVGGRVSGAEGEAIVWRLAEPLRRGALTTPRELLRATAEAAISSGHADVVLERFELYGRLVTETLPAALDAPDVNSYHRFVYDLMPPAIAAILLADVLNDAGPDDNVRDHVAARGRVVEEVRVRLTDAIDCHVLNMMWPDSWWNHQIDLLRRTATARDIRAAARHASTLIEQRYLYPRVMRNRLLIDAAF